MSGIFDDRHAEFIRIISEGGTLNDVAAALKVDRSTPLRWLREDETGELRNQYARAREDQGDLSADDIKEISRKVQSGELTPEQGRVAILAAQWDAGKRKPKVYGDKQQIEHGSDPANPIKTVTEIRLVGVRADGGG